MAFSDDIADDLGIVDGVETVTFQRRDVDGTVTTEYATVTASFTAISAAPIATSQAGQAVSYQASVRIQANTLAVTPRRNDRIVSVTKGTWEVTTADTVSLLTEYVCRVKKVS